MKKFVNLENTKFARFPGLVPLLEKILYVPAVNQICNNLPDTNDLEKILESILLQLDIKLNYLQDDLKMIPTTGPTIVVANHPYGGIEGVALAYLLMQVRKDVKILANFLLSEIAVIDPLFISIDPFKTKKGESITSKGLKKANEWLENGGLLIIFPAGTVSHWQWKQWEITDPTWKLSAARLAVANNATVVPVYFSGQNSWYFHLAGIISPYLRTLLLGQQVFAKQHRTLDIALGKPITTTELSKIQDLKDQMYYLRLRTYLLAYQSKPSTVPQVKALNAPATKPAELSLLQHDLEHLPTTACLAELGEYAVYIAHAHEIPNILLEIGRLREITFEQIGEGTGRINDLDNYDQHYAHLFIWHKKDQKIVGAYRLGLSNEILPKLGSAGMYLSTLYQLSPAFLATIQPTIELGRSFISLEYQRKPQPLLLLWKGIGRFLVNNPDYISLVGVVSVSHNYQQLSRDLIVYFLHHYYIKHDLASLVSAKLAYSIRKKIPKVIREIIANKHDLDTLDFLISEIEYDHKGLPVLFRQYDTLHAKFVGFSLDPNFRDSLDCLSVAYIKDMPYKRLVHYMEREGVETYYNYNKIQRE